MNTQRRLFATLALVIFGSALLGFAPALQGAGQEEPEEEASVLTTNMETINGGLRNLRRRVKDPEQRATCLEIVHEIQLAVVIAKNESFPMADKAEGEAREELLSGFRKGMAQVLAVTAELEIAIIESRGDDAARVLKRLNEMKEEAHEVYQEDE